MLIQCNKPILLVDLKEMREQQCFSSLKKRKKQFLILHKMLQVSYKMEIQKIKNLLNDSSDEKS